MEFKVTTRSEFETIEIAQNFESEKFPNMIICLNGELGSGKTVFTKGIANALGIDESITSPTFTIIKEYDGELPLYHMDVYRLDGNVSGIGIVIEKSFQPGRKLLESRGYDIYSLARIKQLSDGKIYFL